MTFRYGETKSFPVESRDRSIWYGIIEYHQRFDSGFVETNYTASKSGLISLATDIKRLGESGAIFMVIGVWHGQWKTDIFVLDKTELLEKISSQRN